MSGIVGILNISGAPVDQKTFGKLLKQLEFRGPDRQGAWYSGNVALGHSLLSTTFESHHEKQPLCFREKCWLVADARIDNRNDLIRLLKTAGQEIPKKPTDPELIIRAYDVWGSDCTAHLIGDYAFSIWDQPKQRLFCARDHFGIKPFFYSRVGDALIFSNSLSCLKQYPGISSELNRQAVLDFLLFGMNLDLDTSIYDQVKRLPPAHQIVLDREKLKIQRFWTLSPSTDVRYKKSDDYIEHFNQLINTAVSDRLRIENTAIEMSGGLDSTSIAASARTIIDQSDKLKSLRAYTIVYDSLIPDEERRYSDLAANHLGIDIVHIPADDCDLLSGDTDPSCQTPEPSDNLCKSFIHQHAHELPGFSRVCLNGQGADEILRGQPVWSIFGKANFRDIFGQLMISLWNYYQRPPLGIHTLYGGFRKQKEIPELPLWIQPGLLKSCDRQEHWDLYWRPSLVDRSHVRSGVVPRFQPGFHWTQYVESYDLETLRAVIEYRWPFLDIRVIQDLLAFPPLPWFKNKFILRESMRGQVPETIRMRPKTPLKGFPYLEQFKQGRIAWDGYTDQNTKLNEFVDTKRLELSIKAGVNANNAILHLRPMLLYNWLSISK